MGIKQKIEEFVSKILSNSYRPYETHIVDMLSEYIKRLDTQLHYLNTKVLASRYFVNNITIEIAHIIGEMNGFFNALSMVGIVTNVPNVTFVENQLCIYATENNYLKIPMN